MPDAEDRSQDSAEAKLDAIALAEEAEAEAAEAEALAAAARARARAIRLRREAQAKEAEEAGETTTVVAEADDAAAERPATPEPPEAPKPPSRRWLAPRVRTILAAATIAAICALLGASGWMLWHHQRAVADRQRSAAFVAAAKQEVINLTSLDFNKAKEGVQRILDNATGEFRDDFQRRADDFASVVQDSKAVTDGKVVAAAVESMDRDSAVVLVLANERITNVAGAKDDLRPFRFRVSVARDGDQMKISKVEYVL
jgi:Mce-associated membrane protein